MLLKVISHSLSPDINPRIACFESTENCKVHLISAEQQFLFSGYVSILYGTPSSVPATSLIISYQTELNELDLKHGKKAQEQGKTERSVAVVLNLFSD